MHGDFCGLILWEVRLTLLGVVRTHDGRQVGVWCRSLTGCHVSLILLILNKLASYNLLNAHIILTTLDGQILHLLQFLHQLSRILSLVLHLLVLVALSDDIWMLLDELLNEILLGILIPRSIFVRIVSIIFLSRYFGI